MLRFLSLCGAAIAAYVLVPRDAGDLSAAQLAQGGQHLLPIPVGAGANVIAIRAEGDTLIFHVDGPSGWLRGKTSAEVATAMRGSLCRTDEFRTVLASGKSVRADVSTEGSAAVPGDLITGCA